MTELNGDDTYLSAMVGIIDVSGPRTLLLRRFDTDRDYPSRCASPEGGSILEKRPQKRQCARSSRRPGSASGSWRPWVEVGRLARLAEPI